MITVERYRQITGDDSTTESRVERCIDDAVDALEEHLGRPLAYGERTEAMTPDRNGRLWPKATPIAEAEGYTIRGLGLVASAPFGSDPLFDERIDLDVTYTGGWADTRLDEEDQEGPELPTCIQRDLAFVAYRLAHPDAASASAFPAGATAVSLGDASVTFGAGGAPAGSGDTSSWWSLRTRGYRWSGPLGVLV